MDIVTIVVLKIFVVKVMKIIVSPKLYAFVDSDAFESRKGKSVPPGASRDR